MGFKARQVEEKLYKAIKKQLGEVAQTKDELLDKLRPKKRIEASKKKVKKQLGKLVRKGKVVQVGQRAKARFERKK